MPRPKNIHIRRISAHGTPAQRPLAQPEPEPIRKLRAELERKTRILESSLLSLDNLISPLDWLDAGDGFPGFGSWRFVRPVNRTQDRTHAPINYLNEEEWRWSVAYGRDLCMRNHLAIGFRDHVANFIGPITISFVLRGQSPGATSSGPDNADSLDTPAIDPLVRECTSAWEEWCELAEWGQGELDREEECRRRWIVEGECTLRFFGGDNDSDGLPYVRHIEPELIRTPPGHSTIDHWGWGIRTADDDDERELGLWVCHPENVSEGKVVEAEEYVRIKSNVDRTIRRGLSDFFPVAEQLRKVMGLLDNMAHVARLQAAIAWWEQYPNAAMSQVQTMIDQAADYTRSKLPPNMAGSNVDVANYEPGTVVRTEQRQVNPGPVSTGATQFAQVEQMVLRGVGFRWGCPSYFSGDGQDSFASVLVTGSPFVRITESRQEKFKGFCRKVAYRVLEFCEQSGRLPSGTCKRVRPVATARPVVIADEEKQARTFLSLYEKNCADPVEFIRKRGGDPKVVAANIAAWQKKFASQGSGVGSQGAGQESGISGQGSSTPAPPGSAGGDGSSPNVEGRRFGESEDGSKDNLSHPVGQPYEVNGHLRVNVDTGHGIVNVPATANPANTPASGTPSSTNSNAIPADATKQGEPSGTKPQQKAELKSLLGKQNDDDARLKTIQASNADVSDKAEAAASVLMGDGASWQLTGHESTPVGDGHDIRHDDGAILRLLDAKTRESKDTVTVSDGERLSKIAEALQALSTSNKPVVPGYLHVNKTTGATFVTGFSPGEEATYVATATKKKPKSVYTDLDEWKKEVKKRLASNDRDAPIPALQLSPELTTNFDKWTPEQLKLAREKYTEATNFLAHPDNYPQYAELIRDQARARVVAEAKKAITAAGDHPLVVAGLLKPYLKGNPDLIKELKNVKELRDAFRDDPQHRQEVLASAQPEEITKAVSEMSDEAKGEVAKHAIAGMSDEELKKLPPDLVARLLKLHAPPPRN